MTPVVSFAFDDLLELTKFLSSSANRSDHELIGCNRSIF